MANKILVTAVFRGNNGHGGFLTGETYHLALKRDNGIKYAQHAGMLRVERQEDKNFHSVGSDSPLVIENDEQFHEMFETKDKINFDGLEIDRTSAKKATEDKKADADERAAAALEFEMPKKKRAKKAAKKQK
jgi:hypothetical protein